MQETDEELIKLYKDGDETVLKELIDRYVSSLYNFVRRLGARGESNDIVQEIFIKVWKNLGRFDSAKASFKTWIFTIARNATTDFLRKKKSSLFADMQHNDEDINSFEENIPDEQILPEIALQKLADKELLNSILNKLRPNYVEILTLHYQEEMSFEEIGKILNKPLNTVKSQHRRAIIELRKMLEK